MIQCLPQEATLTVQAHSTYLLLALSCVSSAEFWLEKPGLMLLSPYQHTLYLDADTRVRSHEVTGLLARLVRGNVSLELSGRAT